MVVKLLVVGPGRDNLARPIFLPYPVRLVSIPSRPAKKRRND
jgi:hypothetical protein